MKVGGTVLLGFAIMTSSHLSVKGYKRCKFSDMINTADCSGLTDAASAERPLRKRMIERGSAARQKGWGGEGVICFTTLNTH
jgi:hypothetical protein